jgi:hypothetical protein
MLASCVFVAPGALADNDVEKREALRQEVRQQFKEQLADRVYVITLNDGTRCAVLYERDSYGGTGGIDCDWSDLPARKQ